MRGLFPTSHKKYGLRSQARKEIILSALANEEEAELIKLVVKFNGDSYGSKMPPGNHYRDFIDSQWLLFKLYQNKYQLKNSKISSKEDDLRTSTLKLIDDFKYMKKHGILQLMRDNVMAHRAKFGIT